MSIKLVEEFIHSSYDPFVLLGYYILKLIVATLHQFLDNRHLFLRVHNVVLVISRNKAESRFVGIGEATGSSGTFFGDHFHYSCDSTRAIDSSSRGILKHSKTLDAFSCKAWDCGGYQQLSIFGDEIFRFKVYFVLEDNPIEHP